MRYGDMGKRILACIIDSILLNLICGLVLSILMAANLTILAFIVLPFISILYYVLMEGGSWHGSVGKHLMGMYVADESGMGISYTTAFLRSICKFFSGMFLCIGYLIGFFDNKKQCLHDMMAKTYVLEGVARSRHYGPGGTYNSNVPELVCINGPIAGNSYVVPSEGLLIGRDSVSCQVALPASQRNISRIHCLLTYNSMSGMFVLNDRNSTYGTYLSNGSRVGYNKPAALSKGDRFYLATTDILFEVR